MGRGGRWWRICSLAVAVGICISATACIKIECRSTDSGCNPLVDLLRLSSISSGPRARFVYVLSSTDSTIHGYQVDYAAGTLAPIGVTSLSVATKPLRAVAADPGGRYLFAALDNTNEVGAFRIDSATAELSLIEQRSTGALPIDIAVAAY